MTKLFGILNLTPDSFSDGQTYNQSDYIQKARRMIETGAYAIDIGAESTRPGATPITPEEEWARIEPILTALSSSCGSTAGSRAVEKDPVVKPQDDMTLSIDTRNPETARKALAYDNVKYLNDVSGFNNPEMLELAAKHEINIIAMHSLTIPADKNITLTTPVIETIEKWIDEKFTQFTKVGIRSQRIIFDPGLGFGKAAEQSMELIHNARHLTETCHRYGAKILYGHSRKSFLGGVMQDRDQKTANISLYLQKCGVDYIRVHNIEMNNLMENPN